MFLSNSLYRLWYQIAYYHCSDVPRNRLVELVQGVQRRHRDCQAALLHILEGQPLSIRDRPEEWFHQYLCSQRSWTQAHDLWRPNKVYN